MLILDSWLNIILQPIPFTADTLLGSFYKLPDGSILVGGKEATSCGINPYSGKVTASECLPKIIISQRTVPGISIILLWESEGNMSDLSWCMDHAHWDSDNLTHAKKASLVNPLTPGNFAKRCLLE